MFAYLVWVNKGPKSPSLRPTICPTRQHILFWSTSSSLVNEDQREDLVSSLKKKTPTVSLFALREETPCEQGNAWAVYLWEASTKKEKQTLFGSDHSHQEQNTPPLYENRI